MKTLLSAVVASGLLVSLPSSAAAQAATKGDVYHVQFGKAVPGQGVALGEALSKPDPSSPMPDHFIVLRHEQGDDWDYCVIQHLGSTATVDAAPSAAPPAAGLTQWHTDSFVAGPPWAEFVKSMGIGEGAGSTAGSVYVVGVFRAVAGHRDQLGQQLRNPLPSKVPVSRVVLQHLEGGPWQFIALDRYNSWQDFAADQAPAAAGAASEPDAWSRTREHSSFHRDTIANRISPK